MRMCARPRRLCECVCVCITVYPCVSVCMGVILMGDLLHENERTELERNWSIVKQTGINNL